MLHRKASVDEGDDINNYKTVLEKHINRMQVAEAVITELRPKMAAFHAKVEGSLAKIEGLFTDMAPEPQKGKPMPPGMINALLRVPKEATTCGEADFIECFQRKFFVFNPKALLHSHPQALLHYSLAISLCDYICICRCIQGLAHARRREI